MRRLTRLLALAALLTGATTASALEWPHPGAQGRGTLLPAEQAFDLLGASVQNGHLRVEWRIARGYYLYRDRIHVRQLQPTTARLLPVRLPPATQVDEPGLGKIAVYHGDLIIDYALADRRKPPEVIEVEYQGCAEIGVCYQPQKRRLDLRKQQD